MKKLMVLLTIVFVVACSNHPSDSAIQTATAQGTPYPRILDPRPKKYLLSAEELPTNLLPDGVGYYKPIADDVWVEETKNSDILENRGEEAGVSVGGSV